MLYHGQVYGESNISAALHGAREMGGCELRVAQLGSPQVQGVRLASFALQAVDGRSSFQIWLAGYQFTLIHMPSGRGLGAAHYGGMCVHSTGVVWVLTEVGFGPRYSTSGGAVARLVATGQSSHQDQREEGF
jgi:hypothetical protein